RKRCTESGEAATDAIGMAGGGGGARTPEPPTQRVAQLLAPPLREEVAASGGSYQQLVTQLINAGRMILDGLAQAVQPQGVDGSGRGVRDAAVPWPVARDPATGEQFLKIPVPSEQALGRAAVWLQALAGAVGGDSK